MRRLLVTLVGVISTIPMREEEESALVEYIESLG